MANKANWPAPQNIHTLITIQSDLPGTFYNRKLTNVQRRHPLYSRRTQKDIAHNIQPSVIQYLKQADSNHCAYVNNLGHIRSADASITKLSQTALSVYTADCLPILFTDHSGSFVGTVHAGWKGLYSEIIPSTLKKIDRPMSELIFWIGPCISAKYYEVSSEFKNKFTTHNADSASFFSHLEQSIFFDLRGYACNQLQQMGAHNIHHSIDCTYDNPSLPSYRQSGLKLTDRILCLIWKTIV
ncbi:MAG: peptidoglycan editing factor PgeF [Pseudomonadota bacterium]|nr:peptidoglycan editing factor PgeF [Pseudomonadota bacterium]